MLHRRRKLLEHEDKGGVRLSLLCPRGNKAGMGVWRADGHEPPWPACTHKKEYCVLRVGIGPNSTSERNAGSVYFVAMHIHSTVQSNMNVGEGSQDPGRFADIEGEL